MYKIIFSIFCCLWFFCSLATSFLVRVDRSTQRTKQRMKSRIQLNVATDFVDQTDTLKWDEMPWESLGSIGKFEVGEREDWSNELEAWCEISEFFTSQPAIRIKNSGSGRGFGLYAARDITQIDEVLVSVPREKSITSEDLPPPLEGKLDKEQLAHPALKVAINLIYQQSLGEESDFFTYLNVLPRSYKELPVFWPDEDLKWLEGTLVYEDCLTLRQKLVKEFNELGGLVQKFIDSEFSLQDWCWARATVLSRAYFVGESYRLVPLIDLANHDDDVKYAIVGGDGVYADPKSTLLVADRVYSKGDEILSTYGEVYNWLKLSSFGYTAKGKAPLNGAFELQINLNENDKCLKEKLEIVDKEQQLSKKVFFQIAFSKESRTQLVTNGVSVDGISNPGVKEMNLFMQQAMPTARLCVLGKQETHDLLEIDAQNQSFFSILSNPMSPQIEKKAKTLLVNLCIQKLNKVSETLKGIPKAKKASENKKPTYEERQLNCVNVCAGEIYALQVVVSTLLKA